METEEITLTDEEITFFFFDYAVCFDLLREILNDPTVNSHPEILEMIQRTHSDIFGNYQRYQLGALVQKLKDNYEHFLNP